MSEALKNYCRGCGREFPDFWSLLRHEKECQF